MRTRFLLFPAIVLLTGCSNNLNTDCVWPAESPRTVNLQNKIDAQHLIQDVELAEELSIRFGDERWAIGYSRVRGRDEQCLIPLLQQIADRHGLAFSDVLAARERLADRGLNLATNIPTGIVFVILASLVLRRITTRFSFVEEPVAALGASVLCSVLVGGVTVGFGRLWEVVFETIRIGNGHLSYRGLRLQWTQHSIEFAVGATIAFVIVSLAYFAVSWAFSRRGEPHHAV